MVAVTVQELESIGRQRAQGSFFFGLAGMAVGFFFDAILAALDSGSWNGWIVVALLGAVLFASLGVSEFLSRQRMLKEILKHDGDIVTENGENSGSA